REDARAAWPAGDSHTAALAANADGCALSSAAIATLVKYELYRIGSRPFVGGHPGAVGQPHFPGGACPRMEWAMTPEKIVPFATAVATASRTAVDAMRNRLDPLAALPPAQTVVAGSAAKKLSELLLQQSRLAADVSPEGEEKYREIVSAIATLQGEIASLG